MSPAHAVELFGYLASLIVALSIMQGSVIRLRFVNLLGSVLIAVYGFLIGSLPVVLLNLFIAAVNTYHIVKLYRRHETFKLIEIGSSSNFLTSFFDYYKQDIARFYPGFNFHLTERMMLFMIHRNAVPAGLIIGKKSGSVMDIYLDYVIPDYRDLKLARFFYHDRKERLLELGITTIHSDPVSTEHEKYLKKMGFSLHEENGAKNYILDL